MAQPMMGKPASAGTGPERYTVRIALWPGMQIQADELNRIPMWEVVPTEIGGRPATIDKREFYFILRVLDFPSESEARRFFDKLGCSFIKWSLRNRATIRFSPTLVPVMTSDDPNCWFRENLQDVLYPNWNRRGDGSVTDGGIYAEQACIIPEHKRIWEYPAFYGRPVLPLKIEQLSASISDDDNDERILHDDAVLLAVEVLWTAFDQVDSRVRFILLMTALETIAGGEPSEDVSEYLREVTEELRAIVAQRRKGSTPDISKFLERCDLKIDQITDPGIISSLRRLLCRVSGIDPGDEKQVKERTQLNNTVNKLYGIRSGLAHGAKMRATDPTFYNTLKSSLQTLEKLVTDTLLFRWRELHQQFK